MKVAMTWTNDGAMPDVKKRGIYKQNRNKGLSLGLDWLIPWKKVIF